MPVTFRMCVCLKSNINVLPAMRLGNLFECQLLALEHSSNICSELNMVTVVPHMDYQLLTDHCSCVN